MKNNDQVRMEHSLELSGAEFRELVLQATEPIGRFIDSLGEQLAANLVDAESLSRAVLRPLPESGRPFPQVLTQLFEQVVPTALNTTGPGYLAYVPGGGLPLAAVADLISLITNRFAGLWAAAPVAASIELAVIRWFCELVGYDSSSGGFLTSGGSLANWSAMVIARELRTPADFRRAVIYTSSQAHHSVDKAALMAGLDRANIRRLPVDSQQRLRISEVQPAMDRDRDAGLIPLALIAHAGTTNTGAVDDLQEAAEVASLNQVWLHVDAAYGGFFLLTERGRQLFRGIERADSITLDPHKGLFLPYGTGCLLVRNREPLRRVFSVRGEYLTEFAKEDDFVDFCDISPELSRDFRGLRVWLPMQVHGADAFRKCLDEKLDLARYAESQLRNVLGVELIATSPLSIVAFRLQHQNWTEAQTNDRNRSLLEQINASGRVWLTSTMVDGRFILRLCILSFRTHRDRIDECLAIIREAVSRTGQEGSGA